jgi:predicted dehydrogenase
MTNQTISTQPVGVGLVGAGAFGVFCLDAFAEMPEVALVAVADTDQQRAQSAAAKHNIAAYASLEALLADPRVEIVALNIPPHLHAQAAIAVARAGKHIFGEKPLTMTLEEADALLAEVERANVRLTVDYVMRHNAYWDAAARIREDGVLGKLLHMSLINHAAGLDLPATHWFWDAAKSGGIWVEHGVHFFDAFAWVAGAPGRVTGSQAFPRPDGAMDRVECLAHFGETAAHFYHGFTHKGNTEQTSVRLAFERGYVTLREWVPTSIEIDSPVDAARLGPYLVGTIARDTPASFYRSFAPEGKSAVYRACIQSGLRDLANAVRDAAHPLVVTGRDGYESLRMAVEATASAVQVTA